MAKCVEASDPKGHAKHEPVAQSLKKRGAQCYFRYAESSRVLFRSIQLKFADRTDGVLVMYVSADHTARSVEPHLSSVKHPFFLKPDNVHCSLIPTFFKIEHLSKSSFFYRNKISNIFLVKH